MLSSPVPLVRSPTRSSTSSPMEKFSERIKSSFLAFLISSPAWEFFKVLSWSWLIVPSPCWQRWSQLLIQLSLSRTFPLLSWSVQCHAEKEWSARTCCQPTWRSSRCKEKPSTPTQRRTSKFWSSATQLTQTHLSAPTTHRPFRVRTLQPWLGLIRIVLALKSLNASELTSPTSKTLSFGETTRVRNLEVEIGIFWF